MSIAEGFVWRRPVAATVVLLSLCGCGGGGGGGGDGDGGNEPPPSGRDVPLVMGAANSATAAVLGFGYGDISLSLAQLAIDWTAAVDPAGPVSVACALGGTRGLALVDRDADRRVSVGDRITVTLTDCFLRPIGSPFTGSLTLDIVAATPSQQRAGILTFGTGFGLQAGDVTVGLQGQLRFDHSSSRLAKVVHVASASQTFRLAFSIGAQAVGVDVISSLDARREIRRDTVRTSTSIAYRLASDTLGGSVEVATPTPWVSWFDAYPDGGTLTASGAPGSVVGIQALNGMGSALQLIFNGVASAQSLELGDVSAGYPWSSVGWLPQADIAAAYELRLAAADDFRLLSQPTAPLQPQGSVEWLYSRPLASGTLRTAVYGRNAFGTANGWGAPEIGATLAIEGGLLSVAPVSQLEPGSGYNVVFDNDYYAPVSDLSGNTTFRPGFSAMVAETIIASAVVEEPGSLFAGRTLALSAVASTGTGGVVATSWRQVSGPPLVFSGADTARAIASAAAPANGIAVVEVEVRNPAGDYDRYTLSFPVLADPSTALVVAYRVDSGPTVIASNADPATAGYVRYVPVPNNALDIVAGVRLLLGLPPGMAWQTGIDMTYGVGGTTTGIWLLPGSTCASPAGHFRVLDFAIDGAGVVTRLALDFEEVCGIGGPTTRGSVRFRSDIPLRS